MWELTDRVCSCGGKMMGDMNTWICLHCFKKIIQVKVAVGTIKQWVCVYGSSNEKEK